MLYSQLYRSILRACREFSCHQHTTTTLAISLPLLISVPSAYGAITGPQIEATTSTFMPPAASVSEQGTATLKDLSNKTITIIDASQSLEAKPQTNALKKTPKDTQTAKPQNKTRRDVANETFDALSHTIENPASKDAQPVAKETATTASQLHSDDAYIKPAVKADSNAIASSTSQNTASKTSQASISDTETIKPVTQKARNKKATSETVIAPTRPSKKTSPTNHQAAADVKGGSVKEGAVNEGDLTDSTAQSDNSKDTHSTAPKKGGSTILPFNLTKRASDAKTLAASFEEDSVQKSLDRLSEFYQKQSTTLRNRIADTDGSITGSNVIDSSAIFPVAAPNVFHSQDDMAAYRCEGVWVTPNSLGADESYQRAVQRAQREDGLSSANGLPLHAQADYAYYDNQTYVELSGNVEVMQNGQLITADQMALDLKSGVAGAKGRVLLADSGSKTNNQPTSLEQLATNETANQQNGSGLIAVADELAYNSNDSRATAYDVAFASVPMQAHGYAKRLNKPDDTHYELDKVMFSTCPPANRKWQLEADKIDMNTENGRGEAYNTTFRLGKVPVLYLPYFNFPIDDRRSSGLLTPSARIDSDSGLKLSVPYYLNLAPNYDATITTDIYSKRNPMLTGELRYLTDNYGEGKLTAAYLPNDKEYQDEDRRGFFYEHSWESESIPRLTADAVYSYVSDPEYISDFDDYGVVENRLNLPRRLQANYFNEYVDANFKVETFQTLEATDVDGNVIQDKDKPYSRLPQLTVDYRLPKLSGSLSNFVVTGTHDSAYFKKSINDGSENEKSGIRLFNEVSASYPLQESWGYVTPKVSLQHLYAAYDEESRVDNDITKNDNDKTVLVPRVSIDSGLNFYQAGSPFGWFDDSLGGYRLLSPRLKYTYSPFKNQSDIPNFDTRVASYGFDQLFADSWFLGHDRLADSNNVAVGLNYRYIDAMGVTRFDGSIGNQFFLETPKVTLDDSDKKFDADSTGVAWRSSVQPYRNIWFDFNGALNSDNDLNYISSQIRYRPTPRSLVNFGIIERKEDSMTNQSKLSALTASAIIPINNSWRFMGQGQYDSRNHKFIDSTFGVDYEDCCYGFSIYGRSYYNDLNLEDKPTRAVMAEFRINGFGNSSSRLSRHLDDKILGFEPVDTLWKR